jgi:hypothetical protein
MSRTPLPPELVEKIMGQIHEGRTVRDIAARYAVSQGYVGRLRQKLGLSRSKKPNGSGPPQPVCAEVPSPAMVRLAAFDPVIRRALRARQGFLPDEEAS